MALVGNLKDLKLPSLIQLNCMERNTAKLTIEYNGRFGFVYFDKGQVVHAEYDPDIGEEAIYKLLSLYAGNFKVESGIRPPVHSITANWNNLLLDGLHKLDSGDEDQAHKFNHLYERLLTVRGMQRILIINHEGQLISSSLDSQKEETALHALTALEVAKFGEILNTEEPDFVSVSVAPKRYVLTPYNTYHIVMEMDVKAKLDVALPFIKQALVG